MDWSHFFPPGTRVFALPNWQSPQLYIPALSPSLRLQATSLFPGWRLPARIRRAALKAKALLWPGELRTVENTRWTLGDFVADILPQAQTAIVLSNPKNFGGKLVAQLCDSTGGVVGYVKYGERPVAQERLRNEYAVLNALPPNTGPSPLKFGSLSDGVALCLGAVAGTALPPSLTPAPAALHFLEMLPASQAVALDEHPWIQALRSQAGSELERWLEPLGARKWPVVLQHGDFAPWNLVRTGDGSLRALDWEYGCIEGFPFFDIAYHVLQVALLIRRHSALKAAETAASVLTALQTPDALQLSLGRSIVALAAHEQFAKSAEDGHDPGTHIQQCRRSIWKDRP